VGKTRNIKPAFFLNEDLGELPALARLLFIGLWTIADREGLLEDRPKQIKLQVLPYDECDVVQLLQFLTSKQFIEQYSVDGVAVIKIVNFRKHQSIHPHEAKSSLPCNYITGNVIGCNVMPLYIEVLSIKKDHTINKDPGRDPTPTPILELIPQRPNQPPNPAPKPVPKPRPSKSVVVSAESLPVDFGTEKLIEAFEGHLALRKAKRCPMSSDVLRGLLARYPTPEALADALCHANEHGWVRVESRRECSICGHSRAPTTIQNGMALNTKASRDFASIQDQLRARDQETTRNIGVKL